MQNKTINKRNLGILLLIVSLIFSFSLILFYVQINKVIIELTKLNAGNCFIDGVCTEKQSLFPIFFGLFAVLINLLIGGYLIFINKSEDKVKDYIENNNKFKEDEKKFEFLLKGLDEYEKKVIIAVKEQDGISQSTLRIRTDMSKSKLSMVLSNLEKKNLIKKIENGKFNKIYIKTAL